MELKPCSEVIEVMIEVKCSNTSLYFTNVKDFFDSYILSS